jgi:hypothetical protein
LRTIISFNYELVLERLMARCAVSFGRFGIDTNYRAMLLKPHGSIDAALDPHAIVVPVGYPLVNCIDRNDASIVRLAPEHWLEPRLEVDIVLPMEESPYLDFQWVRPGYERFSYIARTLDCLMLIGLSYWEVDRPEIDYVLDCMKSNSTIVVVNPHPNPDLMDRLAGFRSARQIDGPVPIDELFGAK